MINRFTIYGERCSGTNYLENVMLANFDVKLTWDYGQKHFFGFNDLDNSDDVLFICIVRDIHTWMNSLYKNPYHLSYTLRGDIERFMNGEFFSFHDDNGKRDERNEIRTDRHLVTQKRYRNIFEMRYTKLSYMLDDLPLRVKNTVFIRYEDLRDDFSNVMEQLKQCGLRVKEGIEFPVNVVGYKKEQRAFVVDTDYVISKDQICLHPDFDADFESRVGYTC